MSALEFPEKMKECVLVVILIILQGHRIMSDHFLLHIADAWGAKTPKCREVPWRTTRHERKRASWPEHSDRQRKKYRRQEESSRSAYIQTRQYLPPTMHMQPPQQFYNCFMDQEFYCPQQEQFYYDDQPYMYAHNSYHPSRR